MPLLCLLPPILLIALLGFVLVRVLAVDAALAPFLAVGCLMLWLLAFGMADLLPVGLWLGMAAILGLGVWQAVKQPKAFWAWLKTPGTVAFLFGALVLCAIYVLNGSFYHMWDEYSHWGPYFKTTYVYDALHHFTGQEMAHPAYPQGPAVLYYFLAAFAPEFLEAHTYAALGVLLAACAACLLVGARWKSWFLTALKILAVPVFFALFSQTDVYISVYHDAVLGAAFGAALVVVLCAPRGSWKGFAAVAIALAALCQVKEIGWLLALGCAVLFMVLDLGEGLLAEKPKRRWKKPLLQSAAGAGTVLAVYGLWQLYLRLVGAGEDQFTDPLSHGFFGRLLDAFKGQDEVFSSIFEMYTINFRTAAVVYNGYGTALNMTGLLVAGAAVLGIWLWRKKGLKAEALALWAMPFFWLAYLFVIFYVYVCMMTELEGLLNYSYQRYMGAFMIGWVMFTLAVVYKYGEGFLKKLPGVLPGACAVGVAALLLNSGLKRDIFNLQMQPADAGRVGFDHVSGQMQEATQPGDRIWVIAQGDDGLYRYMYHYLMMPTHVTLELPGSVGYEWAPGEGELLALLEEKEIDYIVAYIWDEVLLESYGALFDDGLASVIESDLPSLYAVSEDGFSLVVATTLP